MFHVGQRVICIYQYKLNRDYIKLMLDNGCVLPVKGEVYMIREFDNTGEVPALRLREIVNPVLDCWIDHVPAEPAWPNEYFRPLIERKTNIEVFEKLLAPSLAMYTSEPHLIDSALEVVNATTDLVEG